MRIAHIIMAHKNPNQLVRLLKRLEHQNFDFYIHVDKKINIDHFKIVSELSFVNFIQNRIYCNWGGNSLLLGIISSLNEVLSLDKKYDFINLLSAQDYPLCSAESINEFFEKNLNTSFISYEQSENSDWWKEGVSRYEKYHLTDFTFFGKYVLENMLNRFLPKRKFPLKVKLYGGSKATWWTLSGDCAKYISGIFNTDKKLTNFLKFSWGTDEFAISTLIMNSAFKINTVNENMRYIDWSGGGVNPKLLGIKDYEKIKSSGMLFGRKFDTEFDSNILDQIDHQCAKH